MGRTNESEWAWPFSSHILGGKKPKCAGLTEQMYEKVDRNTSEKYCSGCECLQRCRCYALWSGEPDGMWGGMSHHYRATYRKMLTKRI